MKPISSCINKITALLITMLFLNTLFVQNVIAFNIEIKEKYSSADTIEITKRFLVEFNSYDIHLETGDIVEYDVEVIDSGYVQVFLAVEHDPSFSSDVIVDYSSDDMVRSYHKRFTNQVKYDNKDYSIMVINPTEYNVTYKISIKIEKNEIENTLILIGGGIFIFILIIIPIAVRRYMKKKKMTHVRPQNIPQYPCNTCGTTLKYDEIKTQWYCNYCRKYF